MTFAASAPMYATPAPRSAKSTNKIIAGVAPKRAAVAPTSAARWPRPPFDEVGTMFILAHSDTGSGVGGPVQPWEIHPAVVHFPVALLLCAVALDLFAWWRKRSGYMRPIAGLLVAGV